MREQRPSGMSRKRPAVDEPLVEEEDPLAKLLHVLNETVHARRALLGHASALQDCLNLAEALHRKLSECAAGVQRDTSSSLQLQDALADQSRGLAAPAENNG